MKDVLTKAGLTWLQIIGLTVAGIMSFAIAVTWGGKAGGASDTDADLVLPTERQRPSIDRSNSGASLKLAAKPSIPEPASKASGDSPALRMNPSVAYNPFGPLNLNAEAEMAGARNEVTVPEQERIVTQARVKKGKLAPPPVPPTQATQPPQIASLPLAAPILGPPVAPPMPYVAIGGIRGTQIAQGQPVAFLRQGEEVFAVRPGDSLGPSYLVESITSDKITLVYLPLQQRQSLTFAP